MQVSNKVRFKQFGHNGETITGTIKKIKSENGMMMLEILSNHGDTWVVSSKYCELIK
jgi:hypothetical protein